MTDLIFQEKDFRGAWSSCENGAFFLGLMNDNSLGETYSNVVKDGKSVFVISLGKNGKPYVQINDEPKGSAYPTTHRVSLEYFLEAVKNIREH